MWSNLLAETTTDNLLNNSSFTTDTSNWELSDNNQNKVKRDPNTYSDSASKSIRFRYQGGSISQDVDISNVPGNHIVKEIHMNFQSIGCGNTGSQWCTAGADDTVTNTVTLTSTDTAEVISNTTAVPYEDGWSDYSFSEEVLGTFNTDDLNVNLNIIGNDTGNSSQWYGPIIDNINLTFTIEEYIAPVVVEPIVVIEEPIEPTMIEGLDLDTEITLDIINDIDIISDVQIEPIIELPDIKIEEPLEIQVENNTENQIEEIAEIEEIEIQENEGSIVSNTTEGGANEEKSVEKKVNEKKETTTVKSMGKDTVKVKPKIKVSKPKVSKSVGSANQKQKITLPLEYLQVITDTLIMTETIDLSQEQIYGGQQEYNLNTSGITIASVDNNSSSRWGNLQDERKRFKAPVYRKKGQ